VVVLGIVVAVYFLAPWAGYRSTNRWPLLLAFWGLFLKVGVGSLKLFILFLANVDHSFRGKDGEILYMFINMGETAVLMLALVFLGVGLALLRREEIAPRLPRTGFED
jgi:hypothetical protein